MSCGYGGGIYQINLVAIQDMALSIHLNIVICIVLQYSNPWHYISHRTSLNNYKTIFIFDAYNIVGRSTLLPIIMYHEYDHLY